MLCMNEHITCEVQVKEGLRPDCGGGGGQGLQVADVGYPSPQLHIHHLLTPTHHDHPSHTYQLGNRADTAFDLRSVFSNKHSMLRVHRGTCH